MRHDKSECPYLGLCPLFETITKPAVAENVKSGICRSQYVLCLIYRRMRSGKTVPDGMWPDGSISKAKPAD
jgi:hypothetical protein